MTLWDEFQDLLKVNNYTSIFVKIEKWSGNMEQEKIFLNFLISKLSENEIQSIKSLNLTESTDQKVQALVKNFSC